MTAHTIPISGPAALTRDGFRNIRAEVIRRGWHQNRIVGGRLRWLGKYPPVAMNIELLVIPDWPHATAAADMIRTAVADTGVQASISRTTIATDDQARERHFIGSPTILIDGVDPFPRPDPPEAVACRLYPTPDGPRGLPALRDLRQALKRAAAEAPTR